MKRSPINPRSKKRASVENLDRIDREACKALRGPWCEVCGINPGTEVHHLRTKAAAPDLRHYPENHYLCCIHCHRQFHAQPLEGWKWKWRNSGSQSQIRQTTRESVDGERMNILFLEDDIKRTLIFDKECIGIASVCHAAAAKKAIDELGSLSRFDLVCLDHDLEDDHYFGGGDLNKTGRPVADFIAQMPADKMPGLIWIHSLNPDGVRAMHASVLQNPAIKVIVLPFCAEHARKVLEFANKSKPSQDLTPPESKG